MNRDDFEKEYVSRHMGYDPRNNESKLASVSRLRADNGYTDSHIDLCWKVQQLQDLSHYAEIKYDLEKLEW